VVFRGPLGNPSVQVPVELVASGRIGIGRSSKLENGLSVVLTVIGANLIVGYGCYRTRKAGTEC